MLSEYKKVAAKLVSLKSVSSDPSCKKDLENTAKYLKELLNEQKFTTKIIKGYGNPVVFGEYIVDSKKETVLIYGHYDVQPASKEDGWDSDPFTLSEKNGRFYGRGIMDDKCQFIIHILAIGELIKNKKLAYNVKFLFEGNEEEGSPYIEKFIQDHKKLLANDFIVISDGEMTRGKPTIELGNRGILNWKLTLKTGTTDIHSGIFGGAAPNALHELSQFVASLLDKNNRVTIEGFYDDVDTMDKAYQVPFSLEEYKKNSGTKAVITEPEYDFYQQTGLRPAMTVTGMYGGYIAEGHKTTIPASATVKVNFRLVKSQEPKEIAKLVEKHVKKYLPKYVEYDLSFDEFAGPSKTERENAYVKKAVKVLESVCKEKVYYRYVGGTEPVVLYFQQILSKPVVSVPFANEDGFMHGTNENFLIKNIEKGIEFSSTFFGN